MVLVRIEGKGSVVFKCKDGGCRKLDEVYYIPDLCSNIISLGQLAEGGDEIKIKDPFLWVHDSIGKLLMKVRRSCNRLYKIELEEITPTCLVAKIDESIWLWHKRIGHINFNSMKQMVEKGLIEGVPQMKIPTQPCEGCLMGKQTRNSFPSQTSYRAKKKLELLHGDLCVPITPPTPTGNRYFMLIVDDYSRVMWAYLMKTKDEVLQTFKMFRGKVETEIGEKIKVLRTDRGGEFLSNEYTKYCNETGLERHYTSPYSPQQNGVVERRNRTVLEMVRCNLKTMTMPHALWGEASLNKSLEEFDTIRDVDGKKTTYRTSKRFKFDDGFDDEIGDWVPDTPDQGHMALDLNEDWVNFDQSNDLTDPGSSQPGTPINSPNTPNSNTTQDSPIHTPTSNTTSSSTGGGAPKRYRLLTDLYEATDEIHIPLEELQLIRNGEEPSSYVEAIKEKEWEQAMEAELASIEKNKTWELVDLPKNRKAIGLKWVFKLKKDPSGKLIKHKARIVAKGYVQKHGIDYEEVFAPVARIETVRLILALAGTNGWKVHHLDVKSAFPNGNLEEEVYVLQPPGSCPKSVQKFKKEMKTKFEMSDLGLLTHYLGIEVNQKESGITLKQESYAKNLLVKTGMLNCNPTKTPMEHKLKLKKEDGSELVNPTEYRSIVGGLRYLTHTRPDIPFVVGIVYKRNLGFWLEVLKRRGTSHAKKKQKCVALSSCEAEFMATTIAACQGIWLRRLLSEITGKNIPPVELKVDNKSTLDLMKNPVFHGRSKHIDIRFHFIRECIENGDISVSHVCRKKQKADALTKSLGRLKFEEMRSLLGVMKACEKPTNFAMTLILFSVLPHLSCSRYFEGLLWVFYPSPLKTIASDALPSTTTAQLVLVKQKRKMRKYCHNKQLKIAQQIEEHECFVTKPFVRAKRRRRIVSFKQLVPFGDINSRISFIRRYLDELQIDQLLQTGEVIRKYYPNEDSLHLSALIHDLGKVLLLTRFRELPQWAVVDDTHPLGCAFDESFFHDKLQRKMRLLCLNVDYLSFLIILSILTAMHRYGAYKHLMNEEDVEKLKWLQMFNKHDLQVKVKSMLMLKMLSITITHIK
uniref:inositol oxygenase n=1 Tax=Lactuca sativa TaxID=4236 RepID=A0A9R1UXU7_LACSA|nr:hypothetical protein LSAT_V11C700360190 [Lactuca sativa]